MPDHFVWKSKKVDIQKINYVTSPPKSNKEFSWLLDGLRKTFSPTPTKKKERFQNHPANVKDGGTEMKFDPSNSVLTERKETKQIRKLESHNLIPRLLLSKCEILKHQVF